MEGDCGDDRAAADPAEPARRVAVSYTTVPPSNRPATSHLPSGLKATSVVRSAGPPSGSPITCSPLMFQTTAERRCELTRVRPSGLNATSLTGLVSAVSGGAVRRAGLRVPEEDRPVERRRGQQPPSGLRSSAAAGSSPTDSGGRIGRPVAMSTRDTEPESSLAISVRPPSAKIAASTSSLPIASGSPTRRPVATSQIPTVPGAPGTAIRFESGLKAIDCAPPTPADWS